MKNLKTSLISYLFPVLAVIIAACGYDRSSNASMHLCKHQYALCTSALCVPQPGDATKAICFCAVEDGPSMTTSACDGLKPTTDANGIRTVYSSFSFEQFKTGKQGMKCPNGTPWTWCLNKRCTVDPSNPKKAICVCDVMRSEEWMTLGGNCDTSTCSTGYWSGAGIKDFEQASTFMTKALGLNKSPVKWCQAASQ